MDHVRKTQIVALSLARKVITCSEAIDRKEHRSVKRSGSAQRRNTRGITLCERRCNGGVVTVGMKINEQPTAGVEYGRIGERDRSLADEPERNREFWLSQCICEQPTPRYAVVQHGRNCRLTGLRIV